jgi:hypothetical protein
MAFLNYDVYGNASPGADYAPLTTKWDSLTASQKLARTDYLTRQGYMPKFPQDTKAARAFFRAENVDAYHDLYGGPKPKHKTPVGKQVAAVTSKIVSQINPFGAALVKLATPILERALNKGPPGFAGENIVKQIALALPNALNVGDGILGMIAGAPPPMNVPTGGFAQLLTTGSFGGSKR